MKFSLKNRRLLAIIWLVAVVSLGGVAYWKLYLTPKPNIILITIDALRQDHLSYAGYKRKTSPNIDKLGSQGIIFMQAISFSDWTLPSHENLLTGNYPVSSTQKPVPSSCKLLPEILRQHGYKTAAFVSGLWLKSKFGINQGFDFFDDNFPGGGRNIETYYDAILEWVDSNAKEPFFLWLHLMDPHFPYEAHDQYLYEPSKPTEFDKHNTYFGNEKEMHILWENKLNLNEKDVKRAIGLYDSEISYIDHYIGRFLDELKKQGLYNSSVIIITADHGEGFGEHDMYFTHSYGVTEELTRVPLIIKMPGNSPKGEMINSLVQSSDIFATILDVLNEPKRERILTRSLLPLIKGKKKSIRKYAYSFSEAGKRYSVRDERYKLIYSHKNGSYALYDIRNDPGETTDIKELKSNIVQRMREELDSFRRDFSQSIAKHGEVEPTKIDNETRAKLRALGYIN